MRLFWGNYQRLDLKSARQQNIRVKREVKKNIVRRPRMSKKKLKIPVRVEYHDRLKIVRDVLDKRKTRNEVKEEYGISSYQVSTWIKKFKKGGEQGLVFKNEASPVIDIDASILGKLEMLLPFFYQAKASETDKSQDEQLAYKASVGTIAELAKSADMSVSVYKRLSRRISDLEAPEDKIKELESVLTVKGLRGMVKFVNGRLEAIRRGELPDRKKKLSKQSINKAKRDREKRELYAQKKDEFNSDWDDWD